MNASAIAAVNSTVEGPLECDNPLDDGVLFEFVTYGVLLNLVAVFGLFGNIVSMIILSRPQMKSSINYLLIGLARCDTVLIVNSVLMYGIPAIYPYATDVLFNYKFYVYPRLVRFLFPVSVIAQMVTLYLTLTVTMERYVAVCHPLRARSMCTYGRARLAVLTIVVFSTIYNVPRFFEVTFNSEIHWRYNVTTYCARPTHMRRDPLYVTIYIHWMYLVFYVVIPFGALVVFNAAIYKQVRKANRDLQRLSRHQRREIGLASMLVCVVIVFTVCNILPIVTNVSEAFYDEMPNWMVQSGNLTVTINSSVNFVIYVIFGRKFKRMFLRLFCSPPFFGLGRDSPEFQTNDDSVVTNTTNIELRNSVRRSCHVHRSASASAGSSRGNNNNNNNNNNNVQQLTNGNASLLPRQGATAKTKVRSASPGPCVYYPARSPPAQSPGQLSRASSTRNGWDKNHVAGNNDASL